MNRRSLNLTIAVLFLLMACGPNVAKNPPLTETVLPSATVSAATPAVQISTTEPATQTSTPESWLARLEIIQAGNWERLQLLQTFPAEMPMDHSAVAISPDGKTLAIGSSSQADILFYDLGSADSRWVTVDGVFNASAYFEKIEFLPDGTLIANSSGPYQIYHIDGAGKILAAWDGFEFAISADRRILAHNTDEGITLVEIATNTPLNSLDDRDALGFSFSPDGSRLAAENVGVEYLNTVVWDIENQTSLATLVETTNACFSPDGKYLAVTGYEDGVDAFKIFSADGASQIAIIKVNSFSEPFWSLDSSLIAAQVGNEGPMAWDAVNWQPLQAPALQGRLYSFSPDGRLVVTRAPDGAVMLWGVLP